MEENQAVSPESAPAEQVVNETASDQPSQETTQQTTETTQSQPAGQPTYEAVDEFGVPYKNRTFEWKRKYEDTIEKLPSLIEDAVKNSVQQYGKEPQREYTVAELEQFAQANPQHRPWVEEQKQQVLRKQITGEFEQRIKAIEGKKEAEAKKQQAFNYVASTYPEVFVKNPQGQILGLNVQSPMVQQINTLMQDPRFANDPEGLMAASDIAFARVSRLKQGETKLKEQKLQAEVKQLQKQTLVEGGARQNIQTVSDARKAIDRAKQSGSLKDTAAALAALAKERRASMEK